MPILQLNLFFFAAGDVQHRNLDNSKAAKSLYFRARRLPGARSKWRVLGTRGLKSHWLWFFSDEEEEVTRTGGGGSNEKVEIAMFRDGVVSFVWKRKSFIFIWNSTKCSDRVSAWVILCDFISQNWWWAQVNVLANVISEWTSKCQCCPKVKGIKSFCTTSRNSPYFFEYGLK